MKLQSQPMTSESSSVRWLMSFGFLAMFSYHFWVSSHCIMSSEHVIKYSAISIRHTRSYFYLFIYLFFNVHYFYLCYVNVSHFTVKNFLLIFQLTSLLSEIGLNIQEAHAFSTVDGYSLDVFVVDGWPLQVFLLLYNGL